MHIYSFTFKPADQGNWLNDKKNIFIQIILFPRDHLVRFNQKG